MKTQHLNEEDKPHHILETLKKERGDINFEPPIDEDEVEEITQNPKVPVKGAIDSGLTIRVDNLEKSQRELYKTLHQHRWKDSQNEMTEYLTLDHARKKYQFTTSIRDRISHFEYIAGRKFDKLKIGEEVFYNENDLRVTLALKKDSNFDTKSS